MSERTLRNLEDQLLSRKALLDLIQDRGEYHVSIYLPTERAGPTIRENPIRLKNLLTLAEEQLIAAGMRPTLARDLVEPGHRLERDIDFWQAQEQDLGLSLHLTPQRQIVHRLPLPFEELAVVSDRFHVRPLLPLFTENAFFYVLALSVNDVRVVRCTRFGETEVQVKDMPHDMASVLWPDDIEKQSQFHSTGGGEAMYHIAGDNALERERELSDYFRAVDEPLHAVLRGSRAPLVLAAVEHEMPIYRRVSSYSHIAEQGIAGNPELLRPQELRERAWQVVEPILGQAEDAAVARYRQQAGTGLASDAIEEVVREAANGRIDTLLVAGAGEVWGSVSDDGQTVTRHEQQQAGDYDLVDFAAVRALVNNGALHILAPVRMPTESPLAAIYRY
jgi:hypothetical protein